MVERARTGRIEDSRWSRTGSRGRGCPGQPVRVRGAAVVGLTAATGAAALTAVLLGLRTATLADVAAWRVESAVELGVTAIGALVAAWLAAAAGVAVVCAVVRAVGASWRTGERLVQRWAPAMVRRVLVLAIGAGVGLAGATGATAATPAGPDTPPAVSSVPSDLGWTPTTQAPATGLPHGEAGGSREGTATPAPTADSSRADPERGGDASTAPGSVGDAGRTAAASQDTAVASAASGPSSAHGRSGAPGTSATPGGPAQGAPSSAAGTPASLAPSSPTAAGARGTDEREVTAGPAPSTGSAAPADASTGHPRTAVWSSAPADDTAGTGAAPHSPTTPTAPADDGGAVVVQPGDTLWSIAARHLPAGSDDATIAATWPRWHAANVAVVGDDPDVLRPGQVLVVPVTDGTATR